jgi:hypothetical protein
MAHNRIIGCDALIVSFYVAVIDLPAGASDLDSAEDSHSDQEEESDENSEDSEIFTVPVFEFFDDHGIEPPCEDCQPRRPDTTYLAVFGRDESYSLLELEKANLGALVDDTAFLAIATTRIKAVVSDVRCS